MIFLGVVPKSSHVYVGDNHGVQVMRTIRRLAKSESADAKLLDSLCGTPWAMKPSVEAVPAGPITIETTNVVLPPPPPEPTVPRGHSRRVHIRKDVELQAYGYTPGCPGCEAARVGLPARAHNEFCRQRIESEMARDGSLTRRREAFDDRLASEFERAVKRPAPAMEGTGGAQATTSETPGASVPVSASPGLPSDVAMSMPTDADGTSTSAPPVVEQASTSPEKRGRSDSMEQEMVDDEVTRTAEPSMDSLRQISA
eukprot:5611045-Amphidinium_carterae.1